MHVSESLAINCILKGWLHRPLQFAYLHAYDRDVHLESSDSLLGL